MRVCVCEGVRWCLEGVCVCKGVRGCVECVRVRGCASVPGASESEASSLSRRGWAVPGRVLGALERCGGQPAGEGVGGELEGRDGAVFRPCAALNTHPDCLHADLAAPLCSPSWSPTSVQAGSGRWLGGRPPESVLLEPGASAGLDCFAAHPLMQNSCNSLFKTQAHFS